MWSARFWPLWWVQSSWPLTNTTVGNGRSRQTATHESFRSIRLSSSGRVHLGCQSVLLGRYVATAVGVHSENGKVACWMLDLVQWGTECRCVCVCLQVYPPIHSENCDSNDDIADMVGGFCIKWAVKPVARVVYCRTAITQTGWSRSWGKEPGVGRGC